MKNGDRTRRSSTVLIRSYVGGLIKHTVIRAVGLIDLVGFLLGLAGVQVLPQRFYWLVTAGGFIWANLSLYLEQARKVLELEEELAQIRERKPSLRLYVLEDDELRAGLSVILPTHPAKPHIEALVSQRAEELEYRPPESVPDSPGKTRSLARLLAMKGSSAELLARYQERVSNHLDEYRSYLEQKYLYDTLPCRSCQVQLAVANRGGAPANSVVARLSFPDEVRVFEFPPEEPEEPELPRGVWDLGLRLPDISSVLGTYPLLRDLDFRRGERDVIGPIIERDNSTRVTYEIRKVMHNLPERNLDPLVLVFPAARNDTVYEIPYEIHCDELPEPERGALKVETRYEREE